MKETPLAVIADDKVFWRGTKIRCYDKEEYEDYMLVQIKSDPTYFHVINISPHNPNDNGADYCSVKTNPNGKEYNVLAMELKFSLGIEGVFILS